MSLAFCYVIQVCSGATVDFKHRAVYSAVTALSFWQITHTHAEQTQCIYRASQHHRITKTRSYDCTSYPLGRMPIPFMIIHANAGPQGSPQLTYRLTTFRSHYGRLDVCGNVSHNCKLAEALQPSGLSFPNT